MANLEDHGPKEMGEDSEEDLSLENMEQSIMDEDSEEDLFLGNMERIFVPPPKPIFEDSYDVVYKFPSDSNKKFVCPIPENGDELSDHEAVVKKNEIPGIDAVVKNHALRFLPAKSISRCKAVSKEWYRKIHSPLLAHEQSNHFKNISGYFCQPPGGSPSFISLDPRAYGVPSPSLGFLPETVDLRSSCNGLLCCRSRLGDNRYYICNPATEEWRILPKPKLYHGPETAAALAFEPATLDFASHFELICAVTRTPDQEVLEFEIYSSRSDSWRVCDELLCINEQEGLKPSVNGFYSKRVVYWATQSGGLLSFDVKAEVYGIMALPLSSGPTGALTVMHGEICYLVPSTQEDGTLTIQVYGDMTMQLKWEFPLYLLAGHEFCRVLALVNDQTLILVHGEKVIAYNVLEQEVKQLTEASREEGYANYFAYVNSLTRISHPEVPPYE
ncbi:hypothetical protein Tsubulata_039424 [Turnera subulata]|uniref:F-box associated beta-propeller type 1 domain-containing protein n=1 Tax=Turnera subulata TaxID=218843 RepID=A0A9Q0JI70_9ROSI|nr:hypothetical protein Tsubulata_039424 [Turnera subulata]